MPERDACYGVSAIGRPQFAHAFEAALIKCNAEENCVHPLPFHGYAVRSCKFVEDEAHSVP